MLNSVSVADNDAGIEDEHLEVLQERVALLHEPNPPSMTDHLIIDPLQDRLMSAWRFAKIDIWALLG